MTVQRPDRWWDVIGWWEELSYPLKRWAMRRFDVYLCSCLMLGHQWMPSGYPREMVCKRRCCRGMDRYGVRWIDAAGHYHRGRAPRPPLTPEERARQRAIFEDIRKLIRGADS